MTVVGLHDFVKVSISAEFVSCFADEMHRRAGVGNFSFLRFLRVDPGRHLFSESEKNVALFISFWIFYTLLVSLHAASRAPCSCHSVSSWDRSSNFGALGLRWWGSPWHINPSEGFWSRMSAWRATAFSNFTHWIGFRMFEPFRKIDQDFGGTISWNTQPNCRVHFSIATALLSPFFLDLVKQFFNLVMRMRALFTKSATIPRLVEQAFWTVPLFTEWTGARSFGVTLARPSRHSTTGTLDAFLILLHERTRRRIQLSFLHAYWFRDGNCKCLL